MTLELFWSTTIVKKMNLKSVTREYNQSLKIESAKNASQFKQALNVSYWHIAVVTKIFSMTVNQTSAPNKQKNDRQLMIAIS